MSAFATYRGLRVFLTGHTGFKGSWLGEWLTQLGAEVTGFSKDIPTQVSHFETIGLGSRIRDLRGDVVDLPGLKDAMRAARPDLVFHLAAQPLVRPSYDLPVQTFAENVMGTAHTLEAARLTPGVRGIVVITTDKVYENKERDEGYRESDPLGGHDPYSASKAAAEIVSSSYFRSFMNGTEGLRGCTARAGNVIGGGDWAGERLVPDCARAWGKGDTVKLRNPGSVRPWQHVLEPLGAYLLLGHRLLQEPAGVHGEGFNFGPKPELERTALELVTGLAKHWPGAKNAVEPVSDGKKEMNLLKLNVEKAAAKLGWRPQLGLGQTLEWTASWYRSFYESPAKAADLTRWQIREYQEILTREKA